jgi:hypothetical protein
MMPSSHPLEVTLFASARASAHFALHCLEPYGDHLRACSSFVTPRGEIMHWHDFGDLEGPGWAANAVGGAHLLHRWGAYAGDPRAQASALALLDHVLRDGFIEHDSGFIWPYYEIAQGGRRCLNYVHRDDWLCPGSLARVGVQLLEFADDLGDDSRAGAMRQAATALARWLRSHVPPLENGWVPRRITFAGEAYPLTPDGQPDPIFDHSADGLFLLDLWTALTERGLANYRVEALALAEAFMDAGGHWGSLNHDTYDDHENVAYAVAFRALRRGARVLGTPNWRDWAYTRALPHLADHRMDTDRNGVAATGLLWMEESWNTAYLWENAEVALAYLEAWAETDEAGYRRAALAILEAIARHHHGDLGFLTEGVDWDNHVSRRHHVREALYGDIRYTEPLLNNLHLLAPTLYYFDRISYSPPPEIDDEAAIALSREMSAAALPPVPGRDGVRYLLRLSYPAFETEQRLEQATRFIKAAGVDGVLLFEASYDMDPALLTLAVLRRRFARIREVVARLRPLVAELHVNVMITLGHVDAGCARPERFPFQFQVDEHGNISRSSACPLDPAFLEYATTLYGMAAECGADVIWVDDDVRFWGHDVPGLTCFCPHHLRAVGERTGRAWTREELVAALRDDGADPATRRAWFEVQEAAMSGLARSVERAAHRVDPAAGIGLMTIGTTYHAAEGRRTDRLLRDLAGEGRPLLRPGSGFWHDWSPGAVLDKTEDCVRQISFLGADVHAVAEVENHPYTPFGKSERVLALELALDVLAGMPELSLNLLESMGGAGPLEPEGTDYAGLLRRLRPFLDALARAWAGRVRRGVGVAASESYARAAPLRGAGLSAWLERRPWEVLLARAGLPIGRPDQGPHWIAGGVACALSEGELHQWLRDGAVLDPIAAQALHERGWGPRIGLAGVRPLPDAANEFLTADPLNGPRAGYGLLAYNHVPPEQLYTFELEPGRARELSRWVNVDGADLGVAAAVAESADGLRVGYVPYALQAASPALLNIARREQWAALLEWASGTRLPCRVKSGVNLYPLAFLDPEDRSWLVAVASLAPGGAEQEGFGHRGVLDLTGLGPGEWWVERLSENSDWQPLGTLTDSTLSLDLVPFTVAVYRFAARFARR